MSDNVNPHANWQGWRQRKNPAYQWDPWIEEEEMRHFEAVPQHIQSSRSPIGASATRYQSWPLAGSHLEHQPRVYEHPVNDPLGPSWFSGNNAAVLPEQHAGYMMPQATLLETSSPHYSVQPTIATDGADIRGFKFESGCRPIDQSVDDKEQVTNLAPDPQDNRLRCEHPGCTSKRRFTRKYELKRHMKKHAPPISFPCPVLGCAYQGSRSFYRPDKLKAHLRMSHTDDAPCQCPVQDCPIQTLPLDLLIVHEGFHSRYHRTVLLLRNCKKNGLAKYDGGRHVSRCPIGNSQTCGAWISTRDLSQHILSHSEEDRLKFRTDALEAGYDSMDGRPVCPICPTDFASVEAFAMHIHLEHLLEPGSKDAEHFSVFHHTLLEHRNSWAKQTELSVWALSSVNLDGAPNCPTCQAPLCPTDWKRREECDANIDQHRNMHKEDITDVIQHRRQILKLYPDFGNHCIFDDLRPTSSAQASTDASSN